MAFRLSISLSFVADAAATLITLLVSLMPRRFYRFFRDDAVAMLRCDAYAILPLRCAGFAFDDADAAFAIHHAYTRCRQRDARLMFYAMRCRLRLY